jgi:hypothetical protein
VSRYILAMPSHLLDECRYRQAVPLNSVMAGRIAPRIGLKHACTGPTPGNVLVRTARHLGRLPHAARAEPSGASG